ncbi:MAG: hypothetical protein JKY15_01780 [Deltaproteobacteria bacterium]|nr:hypothetical protein [Deltaproteobacteria bacterium]
MRSKDSILKESAPLSYDERLDEARLTATTERALLIDSQRTIEDLPELPTDRVEWELYCRGAIKGIKNRLRLRPMLLKVVKDDHPFKFLLWARQWGKTTTMGTELAYRATTRNNYDQTYFNFKDANLKTFTETKFRQDIFGHEPLSKHVAGISRLGSQNRVIIKKTQSIIDMMLPGENWSNAQGKSLMRIVIDEGQDEDWTGFNNARQTQADTMGDTLIGGVGGFKSSKYDKLWQTTNQMEYKFRRGENFMGYSNNSWRDGLEFNDEGLIEDDYLLDVLDGDFVAAAPKNFYRHGYHLDQIQNPRIPITILSAIEDYKVNPEWSIEWQIKKDPYYDPLEFARNNLALMVQGDEMPFTEEIMLKLVDKNLSFVASQDVDHSLGDVFVGADWGGGPKTVVWVWQCINNQGPVFRLLFAAKLAGKTSDEQYQIVRNIIDAYGATQSVVDSGGGTHQVESLMKYFGPRCLRLVYLTRPERPRPNIKEMIKYRQDNKYEIDRTYSIDAIKNLVTIPFDNNGQLTPRIILPGADYSKIEWIIDQFTNEQVELINIGTARRPYRRYFIEDQKRTPDDALQAANFARIAWMISQGKAVGHVGGGIEDEE